MAVHTFRRDWGAVPSDQLVAALWRCQAATLMPIENLVARLGEDYPVPEVGERARCKTATRE